jgi:hypothetical protein
MSVLDTLFSLAVLTRNSGRGGGWITAAAVTLLIVCYLWVKYKADHD